MQVTSGETVLELTENGVFTLLDGLSEPTDYSVSITNQPMAPRQLCTVANAAGTMDAGSVRNIQIACTNALKFTARVTDAPIAYASVSVTIGDRVFTTIADANGVFTVNIPVFDADTAKMVIAEATGSADQGQAHVTFANILGTLSTVVDGASGDGEIAGEENSGTNITNVSTAKYVLTVQANNGEVPTTGAALQTAERSVNATEVMRIAAAIKLIVDQPETYSLPAGKTSILAFASDPAAVKTFADAAPAAMEQALTDILADTSLVPGYKAADVPGTYYQIPAAQPGFLSPQGEGLMFSADGTGEFMTSNVGGVPVTESFTWTVTDGILKVKYANPINQPTNVYWGDYTLSADQKAAMTCAGNPSQIRMNQIISETDYSLTSPGELVDQVRETYLLARTFDAYNVGTACDTFDGTVDGKIALDAQTTTSIANNVTLWKAAAIESQPFTNDVLAGKRWAIFMHTEVGPWMNNTGGNPPTDGNIGGTSRQFAAQLISFAAGGTATAFPSGAAIDWSLTTSGDLQLKYGDWTQTVKVLQSSGDVRKVVSRYQSATDADERFASFDLAVMRDSATKFDASFWTTDETKFWHAFTNGWSQGAWASDGTAIWDGGAMTFGWSFHAGGLAFNHDMYGSADAKGHWRAEMRWSVDADGEVAFEGPYARLCYFPGNLGGVPSLTCFRRAWMPVGATATGYLYVMETVWASNDNGVNWGLWLAPRLTPVRKIDVPKTTNSGEYRIFVTP